MTTSVSTTTTTPSAPLLDDLTLNRRRFLQAALVTGAATALPWWLREQAAAADPLLAGQGILVLVMLTGGNDGLNTVVPVTGGAASRYRALRPGIGLDPATLLPIGTDFALHPRLTQLKAAWDANQLAVIHGVSYPDPNLSHFDSMAYWMGAWGGSGWPGTGWLGRWLDGLDQPDALRAVNIGGSLPFHLRGAYRSGVSLPSSLDDAFGTDRSNAWETAMFDLIAGYADENNPRGQWANTFAKVGHDTLDIGLRVQPAYATLPDDGLARDLAIAARLINANLGVRVVNVTLDGFDTHNNQLGDHDTLLAALNDGLATFWSTLDARWTDQVTVMTFSEFGRRPEENGSNGTDHGTAAPLFVLGRPVRGGLYGALPSLTALDDNGNLVPTTDFRSVFASVLDRWLDADPSALLGHGYESMPLFRTSSTGPRTGAAAGGIVTDGHAYTGNGYWTLSERGIVRAFGDVPALGSASVASKAVGVAATPDRKGYWVAEADGTVHAFGAAEHRGDMHGTRLNAPVVAMAATPSGRGYWLLGSDGGVFSFGDAAFFGSTGAMRLNRPVVGLAAAPSAKGYWFVASDGGIFAFGPDAGFHGSMGGTALNRPVVGMAPTPSGQGYWLVASDGGIFAFGDAGFFGSTGAIRLNQPIVGMTPTASGRGYWFVARDGGIFAYGDAPFHGSAAGKGDTVTSMA